jgi:hypothetical protein
MALPKLVAFVPKKSQTRAKTTALEVEETPGASSSEQRFTRDYIPLRKDDAKPVTLTKDAKYPLVTPNIPNQVIIDEDILGKVPHIKYVDHDITYIAKFHKLASSEYLELKIDSLTNQTIHVPKVWAKGLE